MFDLVAEVLLGLSDRDLVVAFNVLLNAASATRLLAIALRGRRANSQFRRPGLLARPDGT